MKDLTVPRTVLSMSSKPPPPQPPQPSKRSLTLDLNGSGSPAKKTRIHGNGNGNAPILTTPDVQMLKLSSPELAKFLASSQSLATPTPSGYIFPKTVTEEQELYAKGFEVALENMHRMNEAAINTIERATAAHQSRITTSSSSLPTSLTPSTITTSASGGAGSRSSSRASGSGVDAESEFVRVKEEQGEEEMDEDSTSATNSKGSSVSPIDMESQERIKLERKRQRNRLAASKCRKRKLERISQLDDKVQSLKGENAELAGVVKKLKEAVYSLKQEVMDHVSNGCQILVATEEGL